MTNRAQKDSNAQTKIRTLFDRLTEYWNQGNGSSYGSLFTEDADYIAVEGSHYKGEKAIGEAHQGLFDGPFKGSRLVGRVKDLRFLTSDVALAHRAGALKMPGEVEDSGDEQSIQTFVVVKQGGEWRFAAFQNTEIH